MIRIVSLLVFFVGAACAFGAFYLARGSNTAPPPPVAVAPAPVPAPIPVETTQAEKLYYLQEIDFEQGDITVVFTGLGTAGTDLIVRDQGALLAAKNQVYVAYQTAVGQSEEGVVLSSVGVDPSETILQIFRDDALIAALNCATATCDEMIADEDANHADLLDRTTPYQGIDDVFDDHATYLDTILAISENPSFMFLNKRLHDNFPADAIEPKLTISLPTAVIQSVDNFDSTVFEALIRGAVNQQLPDGARITNVAMDGLHPAYLADKDNNQFVTAGGQPIAFPNARFLPVSVDIVGIDTLSDAAYDAITDATLLEFDVDSLFEDFVTSRLQTSCVDCYFLKVDGPFYRSTRPTAQTTERYTLAYYDLREAP